MRILSVKGIYLVNHAARSSGFVASIAVASLFRLHRLQGAWLLFWPCIWGLIVGHRGLPFLYDLLLFACGAFLLRSVGCAYNDWVDQDIDKHVARTSSRPLAAGTLSTRGAIIASCLFLLLAGCVWLLLTMAAKKIALIFAVAVLPYPWLKRFTHWPQAYLGLLFASGTVVGWLQGSEAPLGMLWTKQGVPAWCLYGAAAVWTLYYDTLYAYQDAADDHKLGLGSTALFWQQKPMFFLHTCVASILILLGVAAFLNGLSVAFWIFLSLVAGHFGMQLHTFHPQQPKSAGRAFRMNTTTGGLVALGLLLGFGV